MLLLTTCTVTNKTCPSEVMRRVHVQLSGRSCFRISLIFHDHAKPPGPHLWGAHSSGVPAYVQGSASVRATGVWGEGKENPSPISSPQKKSLRRLQSPLPSFPLPIRFCFRNIKPPPPPGQPKKWERRRFIIRAPKSWISLSPITSGIPVRK